MPVTIFYIQWKDMNKIKDECSFLTQKIDAVETALFNKDNPIALDYIISRDATVINGN
jgi:hypothetical protein